MNNPKDMLVSERQKMIAAIDKFTEQAEFNKWLRDLTDYERQHVIDMLADFSDEQHEKLRSERDELVGALELIASAKDRGFDIDYARGLAESVVAKHKPE